MIIAVISSIYYTMKNEISLAVKNKFTSIEDLLNVNGIGQAKYNKIKEYICVK